jgi:phenylacetic acid degradation operon negative regulatory protein
VNDIAQVNAARNASLVFFTLGAAGVPPDGPLPGPVLVRLLGDLGLSEAAARSTILRMRQAGSITSVRMGATVGYAPSSATLASHRRHAGQSDPAGPAWDGSFHALVVTVPESRRSFRDGLRWAGLTAGYRSLRPGLLIAPSDRRAEIAPVLDQKPDDASILFAQLRLSVEDSRAVAAQLWELDELGHRYRALTVAARDAVVAGRRRPPTGAAAMVALAAATLPIYEAIRDDPGLPHQLLPAGWPQPELRAALAEAHRCLNPGVVSYIEHLRSELTSSRRR